MKKNPLKTYNWWVKVISAAFLLIIGLWILIDRDFGASLVVSFTGAVALVFATIRCVGLIKSLKTKSAKFVTLGEIVFDLAIGALLLYGGISLKQDSENTVGQYTKQYYRFFLGAILYVKAVVYFVVTVLCKEETNKTVFWAHIIAITASVIFVSLENFEAGKLALTIAILALCCFAALAAEGGISYGGYRKSLNKTKEEAKDLEAPKDEKGVDDTTTIEDEKKIPTTEDEMPENGSTIS